MPNYWLMKTEPDVFSFGDLEARASAMWEGVRNYQARNFMRDMTPGDRVLVYHSQVRPPGVVGVAEVTTGAYPDPTQFDPESPYYDPKATEEAPRWSVVDIRAEQRLERFVPLHELKQAPALAESRLVQRGNRLSVLPLSEAAFRAVLVLGATTLEAEL